jgi:hypothetical protein
VTRPFLIGSFLVLTALPGLQMRYGFAPEVGLSGVRYESKKPRLNPTSWWQGAFQSQAEAWFDEHIGFRGHAVRTNNQLGLSLFHEASGKAADAVVVGRRMMIYGDAYIRDYVGTDAFSDGQLQKVARRLRRLQAKLALRGIAFVLLIAPNKAATYPEYLPPGFVHPVGERPPSSYERMLPMLRKQGVHVVDGHAILAEEKARSAHALFAPGGLHWNRYAASIVLRRAWQRLGEQLGRPLVELRCRTVFEDDEPRPGDLELDGADLLNAWHVGHADWKFPRPDLFTDDAFRPKLVAVGDSFWWLAESIIAEHRMASRYDFFYYFNDPNRRPNGQNRRVATQPSGLHPGMSWEYVFSADAIIVEANEGALGVAGWGFVEAAEQALGAGNFPAAASAAPGTGPPLPARSRPGARDQAAVSARSDRAR